MAYILHDLFRKILANLNINGFNMYSKIKILAIDSETKALKLFKLNFEEFGFEVSIATNGQEGLDRAIAFKPDIILLDICMPQPDGWEICKGLKEINETKDIPIIFVTAFSSNRDQDKARELGVRAYFTKPINPAVLVDKIHELLKENTNNHLDQ